MLLLTRSVLLQNFFGADKVSKTIATLCALNKITVGRCDIGFVLEKTVYLSLAIWDYIVGCVFSVEK